MRVECGGGEGRQGVVVWMERGGPDCGCHCLVSLLLVSLLETRGFRVKVVLSFCVRVSFGEGGGREFVKREIGEAGRQEGRKEGRPAGRKKKLGRKDVI